MLIDPLNAISPIDGRYAKTGEKLSDYFSEYALIKYRLITMIRYLIALGDKKVIPQYLSSTEKEALLKRVTELDLEDANSIKLIETKGWNNFPRTNHDVEACKLWLRNELKSRGHEDLVEFVHIGRTSEDVNNIAYALMLREALTKVMIPSISAVGDQLGKYAERYASLPMLSRTHGQPATPTTLGKEFAVFLERLERQLAQLKDYSMLVKLNGASGNYCADHFTFPDVDWVGFSESFVGQLNGTYGGLDLNMFTTQIEPHDTYAELFAIFTRINTILIDMAQDMWSYVSEDWLVQTPVAGEVGSSAMPQKVNPIDFENAEGNFGVAIALFEFFSRKLPISRRQRDLSDSTVERCFGTAFGHSLIGYEKILAGLKKVSANEAQIRADLAAHPEVITEAYQTILRSIGYPEAYNALKDIARGKKITLDDLHAFVRGLDDRVPEEVKAKMLALTPETYTGLASHLAIHA